MSWLPSPARTLVLLKEIETKKDLLNNVTELFWLFYMDSLSFEEFQERTKWYIDKHLEDSQKGGGFIDPEIRDSILQGPEKVAQIIIDKLDDLSTKTFVPYHPDEADDPIALYIHTHIEASRFVRLLGTEQYSERTREVLVNVKSVFNRCFRSVNNSNPPFSQQFLVSLEVLGSFLNINQFLMQKSDGDYEDALISLFWGFAYNTLVKDSYPEYGFPNPNAITWIYHINRVGNIWEHAPWMLNLNPQDPVDCFEAIRNKNNAKDFKFIANFCSYYVIVIKDWFTNQEEVEVIDSKGESWDPLDYWQHALGWVEARLQPSELRDLLNQREDEAAEQRLRRYFFNETIWELLPERARKSLVSADRDWFGGNDARIESILNELKIASEELLLHGIWNPMVKWTEMQRSNPHEKEEFLKLVNELVFNRKKPDLLHYEQICKMPITRAFLIQKGIKVPEQEWFYQDLPNRLSKLRSVRRRAEHESVNRWTRAGIRQFVNEFLGIGQPGVLPQLARILLIPDKTSNG